MGFNGQIGSEPTGQRPPDEPEASSAAKLEDRFGIGTNHRSITRNMQIHFSMTLDPLLLYVLDQAPIMPVDFDRRGSF